MNKKGQALVEFVLILPIFLFLLLAVYDFGMIFTTKSALESNSNDIITMYKNNKELTEIRTLYPDIDITITNDSEYTKVTIADELKLVTPGFNRIFGSPYKITVERYLPYE